MCWLYSSVPMVPPTVPVICSGLLLRHGIERPSPATAPTAGTRSPAARPISQYDRYVRSCTLSYDMIHSIAPRTTSHNTSYHRPGFKKHLMFQDVTAKYCIYNKVPSLPMSFFVRIKGCVNCCMTTSVYKKRVLTR